MTPWRLMSDAVTLDDRKTMCDFIMSTTRYTSGEKVREFEDRWSEWVGSKHSLMVSSGSTANFLLLASIKELYNIPNGAKVLVPATTWVTNVSPVFQMGLEPVFADINLHDFSFNQDTLPPPDEDIAIIFVTYLLGFDTDTEYLKARWPNALVIEDICESHGVRGPTGARRGGGGSLGGTFSFYFGHHMTTIEGGIVSTDNKELHDLMKLKRSHGMARNLDPEPFRQACERHPDIDPQFLFLTDGYNFRSTDLNAVLGIEQLKRLDDVVEIRNHNFKMFCRVVENHRDKLLPVEFNERCSNFAFPMICKSPDILKRLKEELVKHEIEYRPVVSGNLLRHPFLAKWKDVRAPNADILNDQGVYIGNNQFVSGEDLARLDTILKTLS